MTWILIILLITSVYFSARFFLLSRNIKISTKELDEISKTMESNRRLKYYSKHKNLENLLCQINKYLEKSQINKIKYIRREKEIRKEIENISHDLRTPLTSILGYLEFLSDENISGDEKKEYLGIIKRRADGLNKLVQIFYDVSRLEAKEYKLNMENLDINKEVRENILLFYNDFENKNIDVVLELLNEEVFVNADKNALERVITNLLQNAIKYAKNNFKISLKRIDDKVVLIFSNDIDGISASEVDNLFDRFYMKDQSRGSSSSGLGLTVSKLLVEQMNGDIKAEMQGNMLSFIITF